MTYGPADQTPALREINLEIAPGEVVGILGESGCGKSTLALSIPGLLPASTRMEGSVKFRGEELRGIPESKLRGLRGAGISLIHQEPGLCLSPVMRIGDQIAEVIRAHRRLSAGQRKQQVEAALAEAGLQNRAGIYDAYPHQLSGGELNRVLIAQAVACRPELLIADEPTRSLDASLQSGVLDLFRGLNQKLNLAILFITHNPALLARLASRVVVMHHGRIVEDGPVSRVFSRPRHRYTRRLLNLVPQSLTQDGASLPVVSEETQPSGDMPSRMAYGG